MAPLARWTCRRSWATLSSMVQCSRRCAIRQFFAKCGSHWAATVVNQTESFFRRQTRFGRGGGAEQFHVRLGELAVYHRTHLNRAQRGSIERFLINRRGARGNPQRRAFFYEQNAHDTRYHHL